VRSNPILEPLDNIRQMDAVMRLEPLAVGADCIRDDRAEARGGASVVAPATRAESDLTGLEDLSGLAATAIKASEPEWPAVDAIIGNPPFLGDKKMLAELGGAYVTRLRALYKGRVPGGADLVTCWFEKARAQIEAGKAVRAGLVSTNSIRGGANRKVLERTGNRRSPVHFNLSPRMSAERHRISFIEDRAGDGPAGTPRGLWRDLNRVGGVAEGRPHGIPIGSVA